MVQNYCSTNLASRHLRRICRRVAGEWVSCGRSSHAESASRVVRLLATITSGTACALLAGVYEVTLANSLILAFFLALVLGLGESVSIQSMTMTIQGLRLGQPTLGWYVRALRHEAGTALLLGAACGVAVSLISWIWRRNGVAALAIGSSIMLALCAASFFGLSVPSLLLHKLKLDLKIAAGPVTLAITDISTLLIYLSLAAMLL